MANTYIAIATVTVGSGGASSITFSSIPQTYTDLKVVVSDRTNRSGAINDAIGLHFNGSSSNFTGRRIFGSGSSVSTDTDAVYQIINNATNSTASTFSNSEFYIPNYTGSAYKAHLGDGVMENNATAAYSTMAASLWSNTAAITSITVAYQTAGSLSFNQYTTATLYGIKNS